MKKLATILAVTSFAVIANAQQGQLAPRTAPAPTPVIAPAPGAGAAIGTAPAVGTQLGAGTQGTAATGAQKGLDLNAAAASAQSNLKDQSCVAQQLGSGDYATVADAQSIGLAGGDTCLRKLDNETAGRMVRIYRAMKSKLIGLGYKTVAALQAKLQPVQEAQALHDIGVAGGEQLDKEIGTQDGTSRLKQTFTNGCNLVSQPIGLNL